LDALAAGVPVVATTVSNHGVGATAGEHLLLADEPAAFCRRGGAPAERPGTCENGIGAGRAAVRP
jgi:hypothetical protein